MDIVDTVSRVKFLTIATHFWTLLASLMAVEKGRLGRPELTQVFGIAIASLLIENLFCKHYLNTVKSIHGVTHDTKV